MAGGWFAGGSGGCTGGKPTAGARAPAGELSAPVACRVSAACFASAGSVQAPGIGGDASAAVLLASHDRGACPLSCIRSRSGRVPAMCRSPAIRARPSPGTTRGSRQTAEGAGPSGRPRRHPYSRPGHLPKAAALPRSRTEPARLQVPSLTARDTTSTASTGRPAAGGAMGSGTCAPPFMSWRLPPPKPGTAFRRRASVAAGSGWNGLAPGETPGDRRHGLAWTPR